MYLQVNEKDVWRIEAALRMRSKALHNLADECIRRAPDYDDLAMAYRRRANELSELAGDIGSQRHRDTDVAELQGDVFDLISPPPNPLPAVNDIEQESV